MTVPSKAASPSSSASALWTSRLSVGSSSSSSVAPESSSSRIWNRACCPPLELLEPYFFDFSGDLYGQTIEVELIDYLRPEAKFDDLEALKVQMDRDAAEARRLLGQ